MDRKKVKIIEEPKKRKVKKQLIYHPDSKLFEFDGTFFNYKNTKTKKIGKITHIDKEIYEEVNLDNLDVLRKSICKKLEGRVDKSRVLEEALKGLNENKLRALKGQLEKKGTKTRTHNGCYGIEVDSGARSSSYISLFG
jgi:hypothetical protein